MHDRDESVDGDQLSSDAPESESSEVSESEFSDDELASFTRTYRPKSTRKSTPSIDPVTGEKRKRGRPRKFVEISENSLGVGVEKRKPGRPRKNENSAVKRKPGRPKKVVAVYGSSARSGTEKRKPGRPFKESLNMNGQRKVQHDGAEGVSNTGKRKWPGRPPRVVIGVETGNDDIVADPKTITTAKKRRTSFPLAVPSSGAVPSIEPGQEGIQHTDPSSVDSSASTGGGAIVPSEVGVGQKKTLDGREATHLAVSKVEVSSSFGPVKRGRGRPRKNAIPSWKTGGAVVVAAKAKATRRGTVSSSAPATSACAEAGVSAGGQDATGACIGPASIATVEDKVDVLHVSTVSDSTNSRSTPSHSLEAGKDAVLRRGRGRPASGSKLLSAPPPRGSR